MTEKPTGSRSFGAFSGVFVPTFLSIIGVILYLRLGRVVGAAGILGSLAIILLAIAVTIATGLSLSSITTTMRVGAGGAYSIISKALGLEVGGSVGIPLFLAQAFSVTLYLFGFVEAWKFMFPTHPQWLISLTLFTALMLLTAINTRYAVRTQVFVFIVVVLSLFSIFGGGTALSGQQLVPLFGSFPDTSFWSMFALFFPAVTGLMAGVGMSGELTDPKTQIPKGVLSALGVTSLIYIGLVFWLGYSATPQELLSNDLVLVNIARIGGVVLFGILAATFSSALTTLLAAARILQALGKNQIVPFGNILGAKTKTGEPRNATLFTGLIVVTVLFLSTLDAVAPLLTMFFLLAYAMINIVVFIEQSLGLVSFRPAFNIPKIIPLFGAIGSLAYMFLIHAIAGIVALIVLFSFYFMLVRREMEPEEGDIRSGLFRAFAEWAAKKISALPESTKHTWKPNVLLPVATTDTLLGNFPLVNSIVHPNGTMTVLGMDVEEQEGTPSGEDMTEEEKETHLRELPELVHKFGEKGIFTSFSMVDVEDYTNGICVTLEALEGQVFHPNILFLPFNVDRLPEHSLKHIFATAAEEDCGVLLFERDEETGLGAEEDIHIWIPADAPKQDFYADRSFDLAGLIGYRLHQSWDGTITLWICPDEEDEAEAHSYLNKLVYEARLPDDTKTRVSTDSVEETMEDAPQGDLHIIPVPSTDIDTLLAYADVEGKSFLFAADSGKEDLLA